MAERFHVYALDQRGHGDSEWARDLDYSIDARAADALAFIDDQGMGTPIVFGHSLGGAVAMAMAFARGEMAHGLVLVDTGPELSPKGRQIVRNFVRQNIELTTSPHLSTTSFDTTGFDHASTSAAQSSTTCYAG